VARRIAGRTFQRGPRRQTDWALSAISVDSVNVPAASKVRLAFFLPAALSVSAPATLIRTRGVFHITSDVQVSERQLGAFGIAFVNEVAGALGVTAIPGPATDALFDGWFEHQYIMQRQLLTGTGANLESDAGKQYVIDSKAMRKYDTDSSLVVMVENIHASHAFDITFGIRFLVKAG